MNSTINGVPGHPVFFGHLNKHLFIQLKGDNGGKPIMKKIPEHILVEVEDPGILFDIDTPEDYVEAKNKWGHYHE